MSDTHDTIDGLLAEFRGYAAGMPASYHVTMSWADFRKMLDRFDAAHRREIEATAAKCCQLGRLAGYGASEIKHLQEPVGDAAKLREACIYALAELEHFRKCHDARLHFCDIVHVGNAKHALKTALAAPPRNCDVGIPEEQYARFVAVCHANVDLTGQCRESCPFRRVPTEYKCDRAECFARWAQMPYERGGDK